MTQTYQNSNGSFTTTSDPTTLQAGATPYNPTNSSTISNIPVNNTPTATSLTSVKPITIPSQLNTGIQPAQTAISNVGSLNGNNGQNITPSQTALLNTTDSNVQNAQQNYDAQKKTTQDLISQYMGQGQDQLNMEQQAGVPGLQTASNSLTQQYLATQNAYNQQYNSILNQPGLTREQSAQQIDDLQQQHGYNLTNIGIQQSIAQNDYNNAENLIQHQIQIKYGALKDTISFQQQFLAQNQDQLSQKQTQSFQANLAVQQQMYAQSTYFAQLNGSNGLQMIQDAAANKAPTDVIQKMSGLLSSGASAGEIAAVAGQYLSNGNYSYQFNPTTQTFSLVNSKTGLAADGTPANSGPIYNANDPTSGSIVTGSDGSQYNLSSYATDPIYGMKVQTATSTITNAVGNVNSAQSMQSAISTFAPSSSLSGSMVYQTAVKNGIDPTVFAAQLKQANNNFGGITYTGSQQQIASGITQGSARPKSEGGYYAKFATAQDGLNYQAKILAQSKVPSPPSTPGQTPAIQQSIQNVIAIKSSLPSNISAGVGYIASTGNGYIDLSKVQDLPGYPAGSAKNQAIAYAKKFGLAPLNEKQVASVQDYDTAMQKLNTLQDQWNKVGPRNILSNTLEGETAGISKMFDTKHGQDLIQYQSNQAAAISTFNQIVDSKRLTNFSTSLSESALPIAPGSNTSFFGNVKGDSLADGNLKLDNLRQNLNASLTPIDSSLTPAPLSKDLPSDPLPKAGDVRQVGGYTLRYNADGSATIIQ